MSEVTFIVRHLVGYPVWSAPPICHPRVLKQTSQSIYTFLLRSPCATLVK